MPYDNLGKLKRRQFMNGRNDPSKTLVAADWIMKIAIDIPDQELADALRFTGAKTKREAVLTAVTHFNRHRRRRLAELADFAGTCPGMMTVNELLHQRRGRVESVSFDRRG